MKPPYRRETLPDGQRFTTDGLIGAIIFISAQSPLMAMCPSVFLPMEVAGCLSRDDARDERPLTSKGTEGERSEKDTCARSLSFLSVCLRSGGTQPWCPMPLSSWKSSAICCETSSRQTATDLQEGHGREEGECHLARKHSLFLCLLAFSVTQAKPPDGERGSSRARGALDGARLRPLVGGSRRCSFCP